MEFCFSQALIRWSKKHGRKGLPWQGQQDPYAIWVSEIMLQQTQVTTVMDRYPQFMDQFPKVQDLADADLDRVMALWSGLGYYSRARNLHRCAQVICTEYAGQFPRKADELERLPGIGRSTAGAIAAFAFEERSPILDANVKRVISRFFGVTEDQQSQKTITHLWDLAKSLLPTSRKQMPVYTQALMDFGATWCTPKKAKCQNPDTPCPMQAGCKAYRSSHVHLIPAKGRKKESPVFENHIFFIRHRDDVLLQKRPAKAIWGGLYSLIETPWQPVNEKTNPLKSSKTVDLLLQTSLKDHLSNKELKLISSIEEQAPIEHVFSHRRLRMQPWTIHLKRRWPLKANNLHWISISRLNEYGLPQPIRVFLESNSR